MEKDVPGLRDPMSGPYNLKDAIRRIAVSKGQLEKLGVKVPFALAQHANAGALARQGTGDEESPALDRRDRLARHVDLREEHLDDVAGLH